MFTPSLKRSHFLPLTVGCMAAIGLSLSAAAQAEDAETNLPIILESGLLVSDGSGEPVMHALNVNGIYYVDGAPSGGWVMRDDALCLVSIPGEVNCTELPENVSNVSNWTTDRDDGTSTTYALGNAPAADDDSESSEE